MSESATAVPTTMQRHAWTAPIPAWYGCAVVVALWMMARPYVGLRHDGVIYLAQALRHLMPDMMASDLFFAYGSQDSFTMFGRLLARMYMIWDIATVQAIVLIACQVALLAALHRMLVVVSDVERWLALASLAVVSHVYGGLGLLSFAERFVTARSAAEPLCMAAIALLMTRQHLLAGGALILAAALHPLMTLPVLLVCWVVCMQQNRRWAWAALLAAAPALLTLGGVAPFDGLLQRYDDAWWSPVTSVNAMVFLLQWQAADWQIVVFDLLLLGWVARGLPEPLARLSRTVAMVAVGLLMLSAVGADLLRNVLVTQLQVWRVMWVVHVLALALLPPLLLRNWATGSRGRVFAFALAGAALAVNGRWLAGWVFIAWAVFAGWLLGSSAALSDATLRWLQRAGGFMLLALGAAVMQSNIATVADARMEFDIPTWLLLLATMPLLSLPLAGALLWGWQRSRMAALGCLAVAVAGDAVGASLIDRRSTWTRAIETGLRDEHQFSRRIKADAQVYWHDSPAATWVLLKRASYLSGAQGAGILFNRSTAIEYVRRTGIFAVLDMQRQVCAMTDALKIESVSGDPCSPTLPVLERICRADRGPDFMVFEERLQRGIVDQWVFQSPGIPARTFYLYDCLHLR